MADAPSREWLKNAADAEDAAGGSVSVGGMAADLGQPMPPANSPLSEVARWELIEDEDDDEAGPGERYWGGSHSGVDREYRLDELAFKPEHFKPGTVVIVMEPI